MAVRDFKGGAPRTSLAAGISSSATSFSVAASGGTGYPTGSDGNFVVAIDTGLTSEEKILCSARTGDVFTVATSGRGWDDTTASGHNNSAAVDHVGTATDLREANAHINDTTLNHHTQYASSIAKGVRAYASVAPAIAATTNTAIAMGAENFDTSAFHDTGTNPSRFTIPAGMAGMYALKGQISFQSGAGDLHAVIRLNGVTTLVEAQLNGSAGTGTKVTVVTDESLSAGDYVELVAYQNTGGSLGVDAGRSLTYLSLVRLGN